jgi:hypothetical protein
MEELMNHFWLGIYRTLFPEVFEVTGWCDG